MNSKTLLIIFMVGLGSLSCGVKGPPKNPPGTEREPLHYQYIKKTAEEDEEEKKKKSKP